MPAKVPISVKRLDTGEVRTFNYYEPACKWINEVTGLNIASGRISNALIRNHLVAKKQFYVERLDGVVKEHKAGLSRRMDDCDRHYRKDGWLYEQYCVSQNVIVAEGKLPWYNVEKLEEMKKRIRRMGYFFAYGRSDDYSNGYYVSRKQSARIEIYAKFPNNTPFEKKVDEMVKIIAKIGL